MCKIVCGKDIDEVAWARLVEESPVATWFQTAEAYAFFDSLSFMEAFAIGIECSGELKGVVVGFIQKDGGKLKQFFSRRAIINGGPLLAEDISEQELTALLRAVGNWLKRKAIFIETRNYNDYSKWKIMFEHSGFQYEAHLNFHLDTTSLDKAQANVGKHRWKYIRLSLRDGAYLVEKPTLDQVRDWYGILEQLYKTKVKTPLFPFEFFEKLYQSKKGVFLLVGFDGQIIGGAICVCLVGNAVYEWFECGDDHFKKGIRPSSLATWLGIAYAAEKGYPRFDFLGAGKPDKEYGVRDFKAEFGGELVEHGRFRYVCSPFMYAIGKAGVKMLKRKR